MPSTDSRRRVVVAALALLCLAGVAAIAVSVETLTKPSSSARASTEPDALRSERATAARAEARSGSRRSSGAGTPVSG